MPKYRFDQIAINSTEKKKPVEADKDTYIGLEHLDSGNLEVSRWGSEVAPIGDKLVMRKGDVLFGRRRAYQKKVAIAPFDGIFSAHGMVLRPIESVITKEFFPFFISSDYFLDAAIQISVGSLSPTINWRDLCKLEFNIPSIEQQNAISGMLQEMNHLKNAYGELLKGMDVLVQSQFVEMFEGTERAFPECSIMEACTDKDDIKCGPFGTQLKQSEYTHSGVPVWGIPEINSEFKKEPEIFVTTEKAEQLSQFSLIPGDIAMSRKGNVGQCAIYPESFQPGIIASDVLRIRADRKRIVPRFMQYQLHYSENVRNQILQVSNGAVMAGINVTKLKAITVFTPPLELQEDFVKLVEQTDKSKYLSPSRITERLLKSSFHLS